MEKIIVNCREYEVLKIYKMKQEEKDLILCKDLKSGCKECFQRCDIYDLVDRKDVKNLPRRGKLKHVDMQRIKEELLKKTSRQKIIEMFNNVPQSQVVEAIKQKRKELGIEYKQKFDGTKTGKPVLQYDKNMNFIARHESVYFAEKTTGVYSANIRECCNRKRIYAGDFLWKYEEEN